MVEFWDGKCVFCLRVAAVPQRSGYLLVQRAPGGSILPGGRVELLEQTTSALRQELWEELYLRVSVGRLVWIVENIFDHCGVHAHQVLLIYAIATDDAIPVERMRCERMLWRPVDELCSSRLHPAFLRSKVNELPECVEYVCIA